MKKNLTIFKLFMIASSLTFSGGLATVPMLHDELVTKHKYIDSKTFYHYVALAQTIPGVQVASTACLIGYCINSKMGRLFAFLGSITPVLLIMTVLTVIYQQLPQDGLVMYCMSALRATAGVYILEAVVGMIPHITLGNTRIKVAIVVTSIALILLPISSIVVLGIYFILALLSVSLDRNLI